MRAGRDFMQNVRKVREELWKYMRSREAWLLDDPRNSGKVWRKRMPEEIHDVCRF
jgi:hypothetical protein